MCCCIIILQLIGQADAISYSLPDLNDYYLMFDLSQFEDSEAARVQFCKAKWKLLTCLYYLLCYSTDATGKPIHSETLHFHLRRESRYLLQEIWKPDFVKINVVN